MRVIGWRAYYPGGRRPDSSTASSRQLPDGLAGIVQFYDECVPCSPNRHYRDIILGGDWYLWDGGLWSRVPSHPIRGRWVEREDVERMHPDKVLVRSAPHLPDGEWSVLKGMMHDDVEVP